MMIEVNLMPQEMRRVEHTPLPRLLVIVVGTAVIMAASGFGVVVNWRRVPDLQERLTVLNEDLANSEVAAQTHDSLLEEIQDTRNRKNAIAELWWMRVQWSEKLAQLAELFPDYAGCKKMKLDEARASSKEEKIGGTLTIETIIPGDDEARVAHFRRVLRGEVPSTRTKDAELGKQFSRSFVGLTPTGVSTVEVRGYIEKVALDFTVEMPLKAAQVRLNESLEIKRREMKGRRRGSMGRVKPAARKRISDAPLKDKETPEKSTDEKTPAEEQKKAVISRAGAKRLPENTAVRTTIENLRKIEAQVRQMKATRKKSTEVQDEKEDAQ